MVHGGGIRGYLLEPWMALEAAPGKKKALNLRSLQANGGRTKPFCHSTVD